MATFFTSDQHFGHANIIAYSGRPFRDVAHMTEELVARHNAVVTDADDVWHLGDFSLDERLVARVLSRLRGRHHLVAGNHDTCHSGSPPRSFARAEVSRRRLRRC